MIQLLGFILIPTIGIIAIILSKILHRPLSEEKTTLAVALATNFIFFSGLILGFQSFSVTIVNSIDFSFNFQLNALSLPFMLLSVVLPALALLPAKKEITVNKGLFYTLYLLIYMSLISVFMSNNLIAFFIFWEIILISFFFIIAYWGEENRKRASMKFLIFTQFGSFLLLGAFIIMFIYTGSFTLTTIQSGVESIPFAVAQVAFVFVLVAAIIKMPLFPLHVWLPDAHVGAPTVGSILLAGVLLKMGGYALLLFGTLLFQNVVRAFQPWLMWLGIFTAIYIVLVASAQTDFKRIVAYSSVLYMSLAFIGAVSLTTIGTYGAVFIMVSHGFIAGMLFTIAGIMKEKTKTREINTLGGLNVKMPFFGMFLMLAIVATLGVPGLSNFIGEMLSVLGGYAVYPLVLIVLLSILIATGYYLNAAKRILFGNLNKLFVSLTDISYIERFQLSIFSFFIITLGILPAIIFNMMGNI